MNDEHDAKFAEYEDDDLGSMIITFEDDSETECEILSIFEVKGKEYIALQSYDDDSLYIYEYKEQNGEIDMKQIEDEEEFYEISEIFYDFMDEESEESDEDSDTNDFND